MKNGVVIKSTGSWYKVMDSNRIIYDCKLAGKIRLDGRKSTNPVVVGDKVEIQQQGSESDWLIEKVNERNNYIIRRSLNLSKQSHIIAANIDIAVIVATPYFPATTTGFIDRCLVTCEAYRIKPILFINKTDIDEMVLDKANDWTELYRSLGYIVICGSAIKGNGLSELKSNLINKTSLFIGHSGVGKSSLMNALQPTIKQKTEQISLVHFKGKHTTTFTEMFVLNEGGFIIDSPGIKELGLLEMKKEEIGHYFPEFMQLLNECKFNNCTHVKEPGCAVRLALDNGKISEERYYNYLKILDGDEMEWNEWENE